MSSERVQRFLKRLEEQRNDEVEADLRHLRGLSLEERGRVVESVCRDAMAIMRARPDFEQAVSRLHDAQSNDAWLDVVTRFRAHGRD